jgi:hypothetical protein
LVEKIETLGPLYNKWSMDDGGVIADVDTLKKVWKLPPAWAGVESGKV